MNKKNSTIIILILIIVLLAIGGYFYYKAIDNKSGACLPNQKECADAILSEDGFYISNEYKFKFKIPDEWKEGLEISQLSYPIVDGNSTALFEVEEEGYVFSVAVITTDEKVSKELFSEKGLKAMYGYYESINATVLDSKFMKIDNKKALYWKYLLQEKVEESTYNVHLDNAHILSIITSAPSTISERVIKTLEFTE